MKQNLEIIANKKLIKKRLNLMQYISVKVWERMIEMHGLGIDWSERGVLDKIILNFRRFTVENKDKGIIIYKNIKTINNGGDVDFLIEIQPDKYRWIALKTRSLNTNGKYFESNDDLSVLKKTFAGLRQAGIETYFLMFNGKESCTFKGEDEIGVYNETFYGCAIIKSECIHVFENPGEDNPGFDELSPNELVSWRVLLHDHRKLQDKRNKEELNLKESTLFSPQDFADNNNYELISKENEGFENIKTGGNYRQKIKSAGWNPTYRIVLRGFHKNL